MHKPRGGTFIRLPEEKMAAHRGYIRCAAVQVGCAIRLDRMRGRGEETQSLYRNKPADSVGICQDMFRTKRDITGGEYYAAFAISAAGIVPLRS